MVLKQQVNTWDEVLEISTMLASTLFEHCVEHGRQDSVGDHQFCRLVDVYACARICHYNSLANCTTRDCHRFHVPTLANAHGYNLVDEI